MVTAEPLLHQGSTWGLAAACTATGTQSAHASRGHDAARSISSESLSCRRNVQLTSRHQYGHAEQQFTPRATRGAAQLHLPVLRFLCIALQRGGCREWINARRRMPRRSGCALGVGNDQPGASTARKRPSVGSERSLNCTVFRLQPEVFHGVTLVCPCAREVKACDLAVRTGREGGIEMLNCEGRGSARPWCPSRAPEVKRSSNRSPDLYCTLGVELLVASGPTSDNTFYIW